MNSTGETTSDIEREIIANSVEVALGTISESNPNKLLDLSGFIAVLNKNPKIQRLPIYIIFKQANSIAQNIGGIALDTYVLEINNKIKYEIGLDGPSFLINLVESDTEYEKRVALQKGLLTLFLFRLATSGLYEPGNTTVTGPIQSLIDYITPTMHTNS